MTSVIHPRWPAERFFWSVVDAPGWKASGVLPAALLEKFGEELPVDVTTVHAVGMPMGDGTVLACGVSIDELANLDPGALSLAPMDFPAFVNAADGPLLAEQLNLLVGVWEPRPKSAGFGSAAASGDSDLQPLVTIDGITDSPRPPTAALVRNFLLFRFEDSLIIKYLYSV